MVGQATTTILYEVRDAIATITFNRPDKKNALTLAMYDQLTESLVAADGDPTVRVIVFAATGDAFTGGNDLLDFMNNPPTSEDSPVVRFLRVLIGVEKPLIAAVNGVAIGVGTTMLLHCDLVYASERATFRLPFVDLGLCPEAASSYLLPRLVGHQRAAEMLLLGEVFDATMARELGLVTGVVPSDRLAAHVQDRALALTQKPPGAVMLTKRLMRAATRRSVDEALNAEGAQFMRRLRSPEAAAAFQAFFDRRNRSK